MGKQQKAAADEALWTQLATRVPKALHYRLKLECARTGEQIQRYLIRCIGDSLARRKGGRKTA
jgi:hypothetical protein